MPPYSLVLAQAEWMSMAGLAVTADVVARLLPSPWLPGEFAAGAVALPNGANAPADNPAHAEMLPARAARSDLRLRPREPAPVGTEAEAQEAEFRAWSGAAAPGQASRGTPGTSQPGSVIAHLPWRSACEPATFIPI